MDTTVRGISMDEDTIRKVVEEIIATDIGDDIHFELTKMEPIREDDDYNNFRVYLMVIYGKVNNPIKIDITTGDKITPAAIEYSYKMMFEDRKVPVMAYSTETILAEKYETIIRRNIGNTRARDYYDLYMIFRSRKNEIRKDILRLAVEHTASKRGSLSLLKNYAEICQELREEQALHTLWINYVKDNPYAAHLEFVDLVENVLELGKYIE